MIGPDDNPSRNAIGGGGESGLGASAFEVKKKKKSYFVYIRQRKIMFIHKQQS